MICNFPLRTSSVRSRTLLISVLTNNPITLKPIMRRYIKELLPVPHGWFKESSWCDFSWIYRRFGPRPPLTWISWNLQSNSLSETGARTAGRRGIPAIGPSSRRSSGSSPGTNGRNLSPSAGLLLYYDYWAECWCVPFLRLIVPVTCRRWACWFQVLALAALPGR